MQRAKSNKNWVRTAAKGVVLEGCIGMRRVTKKIGGGAAFIIAVAMTGIGSVHADDGLNAHDLAERFANAHETRPAKTKPVDTLKPEQVENAFRSRRQETDIDSTDKMLDSVTARTKTIEDLLSRSSADKWDVNVGKPDNVEVQPNAITAQHNTTRPPENVAEEAADMNDDRWSAVTTGPTRPTDTEAQQLDNVATELVSETPPLDMTTESPTARALAAELNDLRNTKISTDEDSSDEDQPDVTELPEPSYALGGPLALRGGLEEASAIMKTATVLLQMQPGKKGIRRFKKTADPVLCGRRYCYMSQGSEKAARRMQRGATLGPFNTLGQRAGACRQKLTCTFRNVDLMTDGVLLQPVDLKFMRHDRRVYRSIKIDPTCRVAAGRLHCKNPVVGKTWKAWIVPEHIAEEAGRDSLETALQDGLPDAPIPSVFVRRTKP